MLGRHTSQDTLDCSSVKGELDLFRQTVDQEAKWKNGVCYLENAQPTLRLCAINTLHDSCSHEVMQKVVLTVNENIYNYI